MSLGLSDGFKSRDKIIHPEDFYTDQLARWMFLTKRENARCIHENEDILVE